MITHTNTHTHTHAHTHTHTHTHHVICAMYKVIFMFDGAVPKNAVQKLHAVVKIEAVLVAHIQIDL